MYGETAHDAPEEHLHHSIGRWSWHRRERRLIHIADPTADTDHTPVHPQDCHARTRCTPAPMDATPLPRVTGPAVSKLNPMRHRSGRGIAVGG